jgi:hypothetical protein
MEGVRVLEELPWHERLGKLSSNNDVLGV